MAFIIPPMPTQKITVMVVLSMLVIPPLFKREVRNSLSNVPLKPLYRQLNASAVVEP